jgi:hypothetical protein
MSCPERPYLIWPTRPGRRLPPAYSLARAKVHHRHRPLLTATLLNYASPVRLVFRNELSQLSHLNSGGA